jgi:two-component system LytT family response regulator
MKAVIVEDEIVAAKNLQRLIAQVNKNIEILVILENVEDSVEWFSANPAPDLVFMDIHLSDGSSFSIFENVKINAPIIFTTAYDEYALKAFEMNSIDYLLKPINIQSLERAIHKFSQFNKTQASNEDVIANMLATFHKEKEVYKSNFLIPHKDKLIPLSVDKIAFLYSENKMVNIHTFDGEKYHLDTSLDELYKQLNANKFFRANRKYIIAHKAIKDISLWFGNKLSVSLSVEVPEKIIVSKERVAEFKGWFTR